MERAKQQLDEAAEQLKLFLGLGENSSQLLTDEVTNESDLNKKLAKFLHIVTDRLQYQSASSVSEIPDSKEKFETWAKDLRATIARQDQLILEWQQRFDACKREVDETLETVTKERDELKRQLALALAEKKPKNRDDEVAELKREVSELRKMAKALPDITSVQRQKSRIMLESAEMHDSSSRRISELTEENHWLREKVRQKREKIRELRQAKSRQASASNREKIKREVELEEERTKVVEGRALLRVAEGRAQVLCDTQHELERKNGKLETRLAALEREVSEGEQFKRSATETMDNLKEERTRLTEVAHNLEISLSQRDSEIEHLSAKLAKQQDEMAQLRAKSNEMELRISTLQVENDFMKGNNEGDRKGVECGGCHFDVDLLQRKFDQLESAIDSLHSTITEN